MEDQQKPTNSSDNNQLHDFEYLTQGLKSAVNKFQSEQTPENFAMIVTALSEFGISGADIWHQVASYSKRHPVRMAMFAGLVFFAIKGIMPVATQRRLNSAAHVH